MAYQYILYDKQQGIAKVTLNRPEKLNAMSTQLREELTDALTQADEDDDVHVVVLSGNGRAFCAGYDLTPRAPSATDKPLRIRQDIKGLRKTQERWNHLLNLSKPVIARVHGYCLAGGTDLALHCDFIIAADDATFGFPAVRAQGSPPTHMWTYLVGPQWAKYMVMTGNSIDGKTAERIGLILKSVPEAELDEAVAELASTFTKIHIDLLAANKGIVNRALDLMGRHQLEQIAAEFDAVGHTAPPAEDFRRNRLTMGLKSALELRDGPFKDYRGEKVTKKRT